MTINKILMILIFTFILLTTYQVQGYTQQNNNSLLKNTQNIKANKTFSSKIITLVNAIEDKQKCKKLKAMLAYIIYDNGRDIKDLSPEKWSIAGWYILEFYARTSNTFDIKDIIDLFFKRVEANPKRFK